MKKVIVGMSGGVDSSVAAILLKEAGYEVEALFMRNWDSSVNSDIEGNPNINNDICPQEEDYNDALAVCEKLGIKLHRKDFIKEYWDDVFTYFLAELEKGRTPNPDIMCNKYIKFSAFKEEAKRLGADLIATGHYVKLEDDKLLKAKDANKDQSYFLTQLSKEQLAGVLFPLGDLVKADVRKIAEDYGLVTAKKKDSTGICFIGERNFKDFLHNYLPSKEGDVVNVETGEVLGRHQGLMYYTIGQRKGLDIGGFDKRMYIVGKNMEKNILYIALGDDNNYLVSSSAIIEDLNFNCSQRPTKMNAKFRYRAQEYPVEVKYLDDGTIKLSYEKVLSVTPGQACAFYLGEQCIGGGIIKEVQKNNEKLWYLL